MRQFFVTCSMKTEDGGKSETAWPIRTRSASEAVLELAKILRGTSRDSRAKAIAELDITLRLKEGR